MTRQGAGRLVVRDVEAEPWPPDPYETDDAVVDKEPDAMARAMSLAVSALGGFAIVAATGATLAAFVMPELRAALASPVAAMLAVGLVVATYVSGLGLLASGALLHHVIRARRVSALTYEGLVEETSQEFDKVSARLEHVESALGHLERRVARRAPEQKSTTGTTRGGPEPVPVNVLRRASGSERPEHGER